MTTMRSIAIGVLAIVAVPGLVSAHGNAAPPPRDALGLLLAWHLDLPIVVGLIAAASLYLEAVREVNRAHPTNRWPRRRTIAFGFALAGIAAALLSPVDTLSDDLLTVHMVQHLLLTTVAAPLIAASGIGTLTLRLATPRVRRQVLLPVLHSRFVSTLTFPVVGWIAFVVAMWGTHFTGVYNLALLDDGVHAIEHLLYLGAALLFWYPLVSPDPLRRRLPPPARLFALLAQMPSTTFLAVVILSAASPLYPAYLGRPDAFGMNALTDQQMAGSLLWVIDGIALLGAGAYFLRMWMASEEAEAVRVDARLDRARRSQAPQKGPS